jgi:hypothetical protein
MPTICDAVTVHRFRVGSSPRRRGSHLGAPIPTSSTGGAPAHHSMTPMPQRFTAARRTAASTTPPFTEQPAPGRERAERGIADFNQGAQEQPRRSARLDPRAGAPRQGIALQPEPQPQRRDHRFRPPVDVVPARRAAPPAPIDRSRQSQIPSDPLRRPVNRKVAQKIEPRRYQTNASLSQPPTTGAVRLVREYVTNVSWLANQ